MATATKTARMFTAHRKAPGLVAELADLFHSLAMTVLDPYRPELHYMRGPGPKWHAKHDSAPSGGPGSIRTTPAGALRAINEIV